jgi:ABC-type transport system involved in Fe-S cluster assembly fused permease/ATPase subunit
MVSILLFVYVFISVVGVCAKVRRRFDDGAQKLKTTGIYNGLFPTVLNYGWVKSFNDETCSQYTGIDTYLLNACLTTSNSKSVMYTCSGKSFVRSRFLIVSYSYSCLFLSKRSSDNNLVSERRLYHSFLFRSSG